MNERTKELAEESGFILWADEPWNPGDVIDWSCRYDEELQKLVELVVRECAVIARQHILEKAERSYMVHDVIKEHFGFT